MNVHETYWLLQGLPEDVFCADTLVGFRDVLKNLPEDCSTVQQSDNGLSGIEPLQPNQEVTKLKSDWSNEEYDSELQKVADIAEKISREHDDNFNREEVQSKLNFELEKMRKLNETTPIRKRLPGQSQIGLPNGERQAKRKILREKQPKRQYSLKALHESLTNREIVNAHRAESDALALLECVTAVGRPILEWADRNRVPFRSIRRMW